MGERKVPVGGEGGWGVVDLVSRRVWVVGRAGTEVDLDVFGSGVIGIDWNGDRSVHSILT